MNGTHRARNSVEDIATAKSNPNRPATEIYRDLRSAAASGWDFSSRWMDNPQQLGTLRTTSIVPVDLNALLYKMEKILARASKAAGMRQRPVSTTRWQAPDRKPLNTTCGMTKKAGMRITI